MSVSEPDPDVLITDSGGRMVRVRDVGTPPGTVDLSVLEDQRRVDLPGPFRVAVGPPYWEPGTVVTWHWGRSADVLRVVRDDERGLVAWLPAGSEVLVPVPVDGKGLRERSLAERVVLEYEMHVRAWRGAGILRIAPAGKAVVALVLLERRGRVRGALRERRAGPRAAGVRRAARPHA